MTQREKILISVFLIIIIISLVSDVPARKTSDNHAKKKIHTRINGHWNYDHPETGPKNWGNLKPEFRLCSSGKNQSPINIHTLDVSHRKKLPQIRYDYKSNPLRILNNGHAIQINLEEENFIYLDNKRYELMHLYFHSPSEHKLDDKSYPMEIHFVHKNEQGHLLVIGVFVKKGQHNDFINDIWENLPNQQGKEISNEERSIIANTLFPSNHSYFYYKGSLTTPPCHEGVAWYLMKNPIELSKEQIKEFRMIYRNNARPIQKRYDRNVASE